MPFYEYICDSCSHEVEVFAKMSDPPLESCPKCSEKVRKKIFAPPVILKGAGFYETEYGRAKHNHPNAKGGEASSTSSSSSSPSTSTSSTTSKSEATPAAKPAAASSSTKSSD